MYFNFCNFVFDCVNDVIQFEVDLYLNNSVMERIQPL